MIIDKVYFCESNGLEYLFIFENKKNNVTHIGIKNKVFSKSGWNFYTQCKKNSLREATYEETMWMKTCVEQSAFVFKENIVYDKIYELW